MRSAIGTNRSVCGTKIGHGHRDRQQRRATKSHARQRVREHGPEQERDARRADNGSHIVLAIQVRKFVSWSRLT